MFQESTFLSLILQLCKLILRFPLLDTAQLVDFQSDLSGQKVAFEQGLK